MSRLVLAGAIGALLGGCGGGGGDDGGSGGIDGVGDIEEDVLRGDRDVNGDGVIDASEGDVDQDGFEDYDIDGDGNFDTRLGDVNGDGRTDFDVNFDRQPDFDIDGDGRVDRSVIGDDGFIAGYDTTGDGLADVDADGIATGPTFTEPSAADPCGSQPDGDPDSSNFSWNDNCQVSRVNQFATSRYTRGIQRVLWCAGFQGESDAGSVDAFADGRFGPNTQAAVEAFQEAAVLGGETVDVLTGDGVVGPETWAKLQEALDDEPVVPATPTGSGPFHEGYGVAGARCGTEVLFWNEVEIADDGFGVDPLGWTLATPAGSANRSAFSIDAP